MCRAHDAARLTALPFWFALAGLGTAWYLYIARPDLPAVLRRKLACCDRADG